MPGQQAAASLNLSTRVYVAVSYVQQEAESEGLGCLGETLRVGSFEECGVGS